MKRTTRTSAGFVTIDSDRMDELLLDIKKNGKARVHVGILPGSPIRMAVPELRRKVIGLHLATHGPADYRPHIDRGPTSKVDVMTNAEIGAQHEFGVLENSLPQRSWLRMPVTKELKKTLATLDAHLWEKAILKNGIVGALSLLAVYAYDVIQLAFDTGGFGLWRPLSQETIDKKGHNVILIETTQLRHAIDAQVVLPK